MRPRHGAMSAFTDPRIDRRSRYVELFEKGARHLAIAVLSSVDQAVCDVGAGSSESTNDCSSLDELRSRAHDGHDLHRRRLRSSRLLRFWPARRCLRVERMVLLL
jgi:hypothetical protein